MRKNFTLLLILTIQISFATGCGANLYDVPKKGYTQASSVRGVYFDMPTGFLEQATAITDITDDVDYSKNTFLYKNGKDTYLMFNMEGVIVAVEQGTSYNLRDAKDVKARLTETDVCEVWITGDQKISYSEQEKKGQYKLIAEAYADVSVTSTLYATCYGQFATVQYKDYECSMFVGVPCQSKDELSGTQKDTIEHIAKSLTMDIEYVEYILTAQEVESNKETTESSEITETEEVVIGTEEQGEEITTKPSDKTEEDKKNEHEESGAVSLGSNQGEAVDGYSDIYHMLEIGQMGILDAGAEDGKTLERTSITIQSLYTGEEAIQIIKNHCASDSALYEYEDAPAGYAWHVVEYTTKKQPDELYVNIKILGLDGEKLKFRGVPASSRTYDIFTSMVVSEEECSKLYCFYAVPNGCKEYMLECGTRVEGTSITACYKVSNWR